MAVLTLKSGIEVQSIVKQTYEKNRDGELVSLLWFRKMENVISWYLKLIWSIFIYLGFQKLETIPSKFFAELL